MRIQFSLLLCVFFCQVQAQSAQLAPNIFIITTDGFRWQEVFNGADSLIINSSTYVRDTALLKQMYWNDDLLERRKLLMPFVWKTISQAGTLYGNRNYENKVTIANPYRLSYAGYNEILTGYADPAIIRNTKRWNPNQNLLEYINKLPAYQNKVAAFTSWNLFEYILNKNQGGIYLNSGYRQIVHDSLSGTELMINDIQASSADNWQHTRNDMLTFVTAKEYIQNNHPKIVYLSFGETDEFAHGGHYDGYLQSAHLFDEYLAQLWYFVNNDPFYKNNTSFIITTDHGRGSNAKNWIRHGLFTPGSNNGWLLTIGNAFDALGELRNNDEVFNEQLAQTIASILGHPFNPSHPTADPLFIKNPQTNGNIGLTLR